VELAAEPVTAAAEARAGAPRALEPEVEQEPAALQP
jgi:hypothetical protein